MAANIPQLSIQTSVSALDVFSDSRMHGYKGPSRHVRLPRACTSGGGTISKSPDGVHCAVAGKESLRIVHVSDDSEPVKPGHKFALGKGGFRIDASKNFWDGTGLKIDSATTDVAWAHGAFSHKILTSARNGELIMWDANTTKIDRRWREHTRAIQQVAVSHIVEHYCITGSADGDLRVWDLRNTLKAIMRIRHTSTVRSLAFSSSLRQPLQTFVGLDNGTLYRWDLTMGQRGQLDRLPLAHTASVTSLDWTVPPGGEGGLGWLVSGGLDRTVKVWDLSSPSSSSHIPSKPTYTLHPSYPVRRVRWRPGYECELAVISNADLGTGMESDADKAVSTGSLTPPSLHPSTTPLSSTPPEDAVEIWDVRRGWIAKWSVGTTIGDGGINDISFPSSHCLWASHPSGTFSQLDLREVTKPLDTIPRVGTSWDASGSMAFVSDQVTPWEMPYDDISPEKRAILSERNSKLLKAIGDEPYIPESQNIGTLSIEREEDLDAFVKLAQGYLFQGKSKQAICEANAQTAFHAGKERAAEVWLVIGASLSNLVPGPETTLEPPSLPEADSGKMSGPSTTFGPSSGYSFPPKTSPGRRSKDTSPKPMRSASAASSNNSSPRRQINSLPPLTPLTSRIQMTRRESVDSSSPSTSERRPSVFRRPSTSLHHHSPSMSIGERTASSNSSLSLRHVGEGALDDSDSSGSGEEQSPGKNTEENDDDQDLGLTLLSPSLQATRSVAHPSPLSRVAGKGKWTEDEESINDTIASEDTGEEAKSMHRDRDDDDFSSSPSPQSTDSESHSDSDDSFPRPVTHSHSRPRISSRRNSSANKKKKSRSRSSTLASLAAPTFNGLRRLNHQGSHSSIATVIAAETASRDDDRRPLAEDTIKDLSSSLHHKQKSQGISELALEREVSPNPDEEGEEEKEEELVKLSDRLPEIIYSEEHRFREEVWEALRDVLEVFADEGDVQMCSMLALVAPEELRLSRTRIGSFIDAYIDILTRLRLYACTANLRKYCAIEDIRTTTLIETVIYTSCGRCRKPLLHPQPGVPRAYSYCSSCMNVVTCAICRLPVKGLLLQCSICTHGGHHMCYRKYYAARPVVDLPESPPSELERNGSDETGSSTVGTHESPDSTKKPPRLTGQPCAAGCGHYCWATNSGQCS